MSEERPIELPPGKDAEALEDWFDSVFHEYPTIIANLEHEAKKMVRRASGLYASPTEENLWSTGGALYFNNVSFGGPVTVGPGVGPVSITHSLLQSGFYSGQLASPSEPLPLEKRDMPVIGYRAWAFSSKFTLGHGRKVALKSTGVQHHWTAGDNQAKCHYNASHPAPDEGCGCGFYVLADLDELESHVSINDGLVVGAVMGWGKVIQHGTEGWRAEHAKIVGLLDCKFSKGQYKNTEAAATAYDVEIYSRAAIESYLREWGDPFQAAK